MGDLVAMLPDALIDDVRRRHAGPERGYHGWSHPLALLGLFEEVAPRLGDPLAVRCAILFHDAVYEPRRADNESRSAELAADRLRGVVPDDTLARTLRLIQATARHAIPPGLPAVEASDMAMFLDMDLSILGADAATFDAYEAGVRHEYRDIPEPAFRQGRAAILESFLGRDVLYFSAWGRDRFEAAARENLRRSIAGLRGEAGAP